MLNKHVKFVNPKTNEEMIFPTPYSAFNWFLERNFCLILVEDWFPGMLVSPPDDSVDWILQEF